MYCTVVPARAKTYWSNVDEGIVAQPVAVDAGGLVTNSQFFKSNNFLFVLTVAISNPYDTVMLRLALDAA